MPKFRYRRANSREQGVPAFRPTPTYNEQYDEGLTGYVHGSKASDLEERLARALDKRGLDYAFQVSIYTAYSLPDEEKKVDFVIEGRLPVEPLGFIGHFLTIGQRAKDRMRELQLNEAFERIGLMPLTSVHFSKLGSQERADEYVLKELPL